MPRVRGGGHRAVRTGQKQLGKNTKIVSSTGNKSLLAHKSFFLALTLSVIPPYDTLTIGATTNLAYGRP